MSLIDEFTENLSDLKDNLKIASKKISENSKEIKRQTKLKLELAKEERKLSNLYKEIGKEYYLVNKRLSNGEDFNMEYYIDEIDKNIARIESIKLSFDDGVYYSSDSSNKKEYKNINREEIEEVQEEKDIIYIKQEDLK